MMKKLLLGTLLGAFLFVGIVQAQVNDLPRPGILPDHPLYFLKSWAERIGTFFTFGDIPKAERYLALAERRLAEANALADKGELEIAQRALERYQEQLSRSLERTERARLRGMTIEEVSETVAEATGKHHLVLEEVLEKVPEEAREAITRAKEVSMTGQKNALKALAGENPERATEINLKAAEARLNRAKVKAEQGQVEEVKKAIVEFENQYKFGKEISEIAQQLGKDITKLEELVAQATPLHLEVLADVYVRVPQEVKPVIEKVMEEPVKGHQRAVEALRVRGVLEEIPEVQKIMPMPEIVPEVARERVKQRARQEFKREIRERLETEIERRVQCQTDADCRELVCPMVAGADTPRCDLETNICYCGPRVNDLIIPVFPVPPVPLPEDIIMPVFPMPPAEGP